jgi:O-phosphoseryl-tRNA(Cys) synthetase
VRSGSAQIRCADALEGLGLKLYEMMADQVRANFHACRSEIARYEQCRRRIELHAIETGSGWQSEVCTPVAMQPIYLTTRDLLGAKRSREQIKELAQRIPSLRVFIPYAEALHRMTRGEPRATRELLEPLVEPPTSSTSPYIAGADGCGTLA